MKIIDTIKNNPKVTIMAIIAILITVAALFFSFNAPVEGGDISDTVGTGLALKLFTTVIAITIWFLFLRLSDVYSKVDFRAAFDLIEGNAMASAVFFGLRMLAVALLLSNLLG